MKSLPELRAKLTQIASSKASGYLSVEQQCEPTSVLSWLGRQDEPVKMYWSDQTNAGETAMLGICHSLSDIIDPSRIATVNYFGGIGFHPQSSTWPGFGAQRFVLPRLVLQRQGNNFSIRCHLDCRFRPASEEVSACLALLDNLQNPDHKPTLTNRLLSRHDIPNKSNWEALVENFMQIKKDANLAKVVLSRKTQLCFNHNVDPWALLESWKTINANCYQFAFQFSTEQTFIGCSPERFYLRSDKQLTTEALAGTVLRGVDNQQDKDFAKTLQDDPKLVRENALVLDDIIFRLQALAQNVEVDDAMVLKLNHIQHLKQRIQARLNDEVNDSALLHALHPTPAVGGTPRVAAIDFILDNESYHRGWYAGAVGYVSAEQSEFCVAIRSALIEQKQVALYAGAGIVQGSVAAQEWQELDNKIATVLSLLVENQA